MTTTSSCWPLAEEGTKVDSGGGGGGKPAESSRSRDPLRPTCTGIPPSARERTAATMAGEDDREMAGGGARLPLRS
jgi:hypothetical protein